MQSALLATKMRFRSLVVSWCVCAIHGSVQIASGHRSPDVTSRSTYRPPSDIETLLVHSPGNIPHLPSSVPSFPVSSSGPRPPSRYAVDTSSTPSESDERIDRRITLILLKLKRVTNGRMKRVTPSVKRGSHRKRKNCRCRKRDGRREMESSLLASKASRESNGSPTVKSILHPTSKSTTETSPAPQSFADIAFTTAEVVPLTVNTMTITEAPRIAPQEADDANRWNPPPRKRCKKKCATRNCKKKGNSERNDIDVFDQAFFRPNLENVRASRTKMPSKYSGEGEFSTD